MEKEEAFPRAGAGRKADEDVTERESNELSTAGQRALATAQRHVEYEGVRSGLGVAEGRQQAQAVGQAMGASASEAPGVVPSAGCSSGLQRLSGRRRENSCFHDPCIDLGLWAFMKVIGPSLRARAIKAGRMLEPSRIDKLGGGVGQSVGPDGWPVHQLGTGPDHDGLIGEASEVEGEAEAARLRAGAARRGLRRGLRREQHQVGRSSQVAPQRVVPQ